MAEQEKSVWGDPQHWQIILGTLAKAIAGPHQESWQAQLGGTMAEMGQARQMAQAEETRRAEEKRRWERYVKAIGGETVSPAVGEGALPQAMMGELRPGARATAAAPIAPRITGGMGLLGEETEDMKILQRLLGGGYGEAAGEFPGY